MVGDSRLSDVIGDSASAPSSLGPRLTHEQIEELDHAMAYSDLKKCHMGNEVVGGSVSSERC